MIKLEKGREPSVLSRNSSTWTATLVRKIEADQRPTKSERSRYNHSEIKNALITETHGKCAYCESKIRHLSYGDIEHIVPKSDDPEQSFSWPNLTLACDVCNTNKSDTTVDGDSFIDPYIVDPEEHFWQLGPIVQPRPGSNAAVITERLLDLNRADLVERRAERQSTLMKLLEIIERCADQNVRLILWAEFRSESEAHNEYAALSRTIVEIAERKLTPPTEI